MMQSLCDYDLAPDGFRACAGQHAIEDKDGAAYGDFRLLCCE
jgi:hypothetical protein